MSVADTTELEQLRAFKKLVCDGTFWVVLNMNDTFGPASADAEEMPVEDIQHVLPLFMQYGMDALNAYAAVRRGGDVMEGLQTAGYRLAKEKLLVIKAHVPHFAVDY